MLDFKLVEAEDVVKYAKYYRGDGICTCERTPTCKLIWNDPVSYVAETDGCLVFRNDEKERGTYFDFPLSGENGDIGAALCEIEKYCLEKNLPLRYGNVPKEALPILSARYNYFECQNNRRYADYIYSGESMRGFSGRKFNGQRNHINFFLKNYPDAVFEPFSNSDKAEIAAFLEEWRVKYIPKKSADAANELGLDEKFIAKANLDFYRTGCVRVNGKIIAISLAEKAFGTLIVHIEKAFRDYGGVNVYMVREFARTYPTEYVNREDDMADEGLRISKTQYRPAELAGKYYFIVKNELSLLRGEIPGLQTERLFLDAIKSADAEEYYRLAADAERNKYWGYDYADDLDGELYTEYFYETAAKDFADGACLNFAVRLGGKFIGETVLFDFDGKGECKLGVRIFAEYGGKGYGSEAFNETMRFAFYTLGIMKINSSCYKLNKPSVAMHEKSMRRTGGDDLKFYYEKEIT
jgi:RimJ/RimL family protein N-acetyltransferase